jgi:hypothetical protein
MTMMNSGLPPLSRIFPLGTFRCPLRLFSANRECQNFRVQGGVIIKAPFARSDQRRGQKIDSSPSSSHAQIDSKRQ